ncbi:hypothetical protein ACWJKU_11200 [Methylocaldum sp. MU1018]
MPDRSLRHRRLLIIGNLDAASGPIFSPFRLRRPRIRGGWPAGHASGQALDLILQRQQLLLLFLESFSLIFQDPLLLGQCAPQLVKLADIRRVIGNLLSSRNENGPGFSDSGSANALTGPRRQCRFRKIDQKLGRPSLQSRLPHLGKSRGPFQIDDQA